MSHSKSIRNLIQNSFDDALDASKAKFYKNNNALKSAKFVSSLGENIRRTFSYDHDYLNVITVDDNGDKHSGEWLLDVVIAEKSNRLRKKIYWAVESESNVSKASFEEDFSKLLNVKSESYLYLNGLNQKTGNGVNEYIEKRLKSAAEILLESDISELYFCFWASPQKPKDKENILSIWDQVENGCYAHLRKISLWYYKDNKFKKIS